MTLWEHPPQGQVHQKTGVPTRIGAAAFSFEWKVSGLTERCFWTAPVVPLGGNPGAGKPRGVEGLTDTAPHWPERVRIGV
jgi:hypothetical protein